MAIAFRHVGVVVTDMRRALLIYQNYLDCELLSDQTGLKGEYLSQLVGLDQVELRIALLRTKDNNRIELLEYARPAGKIPGSVKANQVGVSHFALTVSDLEQLYQRRNEFEVRFLSPILTSPDGWVKVAYVVLMEEQLVELVQVLDVRAKYSGGERA